MSGTRGVAEVAADLAAWFGDLGRSVEEGLFAVAPAGPHRDGVVHDVLARKARLLLDVGLDEGDDLHSATCLLLVAACRRLGVTLTEGHWRAAVRNVVAYHQDAVRHRADLQRHGVKGVSPTELFKSLLDESLLMSGVGGGQAPVDRTSREVALGLAINWGLRFLLAHALLGDRRQPVAGRKDAAWIAALLESLLPATPSVAAP